MGLESVTYINDLVTSNPSGSDPRNQGDDHIRNIKSAIKSTFANISAAVTVTATELNYLSGLTQNVQSAISTLTSAIATKANSGANTDITSLAAPALGSATATTQTANDNSTKVATTAYVDGAISSYDSQLNRILQMSSYSTGAVLSGTTAMTFDNTLPQNTEGDEYLTLSVTPKNASSKLVIDVSINMGKNASSSAHLIAALFVDSIADAIGCGVKTVGTGTTGQVDTITLSAEYTNTSLTAKTFKVRAGNNAGGTTYINGTGGYTSGIFGGAWKSIIKVTEYKL